MVGAHALSFFLSGSFWLQELGRSFRHQRVVQSMPFNAGCLPAAKTLPAVKSRVRANPGAKIFGIVRVDLLSPANLSQWNEFCAAALRPPFCLCHYLANVRM